MTLQELETLVKQIQKQVELNTLAINSLSSRFSNYTPLSTFYDVKQTVSSNSSNVTTLQNDLNTIKTSIGYMNKFSKLLDVNIQNVTKDDILQWDGDRWTNIKPSKLGITGEGGAVSLESLSDVSISNKQDGQSLCWSNVQNRWINKTVEGGGSSGGGGLDVEAMWEELAKSSTNQINPSHITGSLTLSGLTVNGQSTLRNNTIRLDVNSSGVTINGNLVGTGEITAYSV